jgi:hypothetical protein
MTLSRVACLFLFAMVVLPCNGGLTNLELRIKVAIARQRVSLFIAKLNVARRVLLNIARYLSFSPLYKWVCVYMLKTHTPGTQNELKRKWYELVQR